LHDEDRYEEDEVECADEEVDVVAKVLVVPSLVGS